MASTSPLPIPLCDGLEYGVLHHPVVNRLALRYRILDATNRPFGGTAHQSIGRDQVGWIAGSAKHFATLGDAAASGNVEMTVLFGHLTD
jgi:hypothetical protein